MFKYNFVIKHGSAIKILYEEGAIIGKLGVQSSMRVSFYLYNAAEEVNLFCNTLGK